MCVYIYMIVQMNFRRISRNLTKLMQPLRFSFQLNKHIYIHISKFTLVNPGNYTYNFGSTNTLSYMMTTYMYCMYTCTNVSTHANTCVYKRPNDLLLYLKITKINIGNCTYNLTLTNIISSDCIPQNSPKLILSFLPSLILSYCILFLLFMIRVLSGIYKSFN